MSIGGIGQNAIFFHHICIMNQFGRFFKVTIYGESHGTEVGIIIDGCPPGIGLSESSFLKTLKGESQKEQLHALKKTHPSLHQAYLTDSPRVHQ
jgi:hypothetical protein